MKYTSRKVFLPNVNLHDKYMGLLARWIFIMTILFSIFCLSRMKVMPLNVSFTGVFSSSQQPAQGQYLHAQFSFVFSLQLIEWQPFQPQRLAQTRHHWHSGQWHQSHSSTCFSHKLCSKKQILVKYVVSTYVVVIVSINRWVLYISKWKNVVSLIAC